MLSEGAGPRTSLEQAAALSAIATKLSFSAGREQMIVGLDTHVDQLQAAVPLAADALLRPRWEPTEWARVQDQHVNGLMASYDDNPSVARVVSARRWWGADHPYGKPVDGTLESAKNVKLDQVRAWHAAQVHGGGVSILVVGAATPEAATAALEVGFGAWPIQERPPLEVPPPAAPTGLVLVNSAGSTQTVITAITAGQSQSSVDRAPLDIAAVVMGGSFTSRLNRRK
jgi:predicted Zn-dependent peptidase